MGSWNVSSQPTVSVRAMQLRCPECGVTAGYRCERPSRRFHSQRLAMAYMVMEKRETSETPIRDEMTRLLLVNEALQKPGRHLSMMGALRLSIAKSYSLRVAQLRKFYCSTDASELAIRVLVNEFIQDKRSQEIGRRLAVSA